MMCDSLRHATFSATCSVAVLLNEKKKNKKQIVVICLANGLGVH